MLKAASWVGLRADQHSTMSPTWFSLFFVEYVGVNNWVCVIGGRISLSPVQHVVRSSGTNYWWISMDSSCSSWSGGRQLVARSLEHLFIVPVQVFRPCPALQLRKLFPGCPNSCTCVWISSTQHVSAITCNVCKLQTLVWLDVQQNVSW